MPYAAPDRNRIRFSPIIGIHILRKNGFLSAKGYRNVRIPGSFSWPKDQSRNIPYSADGADPAFQLSSYHLPVPKARSTGITVPTRAGDLFAAMDAVVGFFLPWCAVYTLQHIGVIHGIADPFPAFGAAVKMPFSFGFPGHLQFFLLRIAPDRLRSA